MITRIRSKEEISRKQKRNKILVGGILIGLMVLSTVGFSLISRVSDSESSNVNQNGFDFYKRGGVWSTEIDGQTFTFQYLPLEVLEVDIDGFFDLNTYYNEPLYFVGNNPAIPEILSNLERYILRYQEACLDEKNCREDLPIKDCNQNNLIIFVENGSSKVYSEGKCVYLSGNTIKSADAFLYEVLKINKNFVYDG